MFPWGYQGCEAGRQSPGTGGTGDPGRWRLPPAQASSGPAGRAAPRVCHNSCSFCSLKHSWLRGSNQGVQIKGFKIICCSIWGTERSSLLAWRKPATTFLWRKITLLEWNSWVKYWSAFRFILSDISVMFFYTCIVSYCWFWAQVPCTLFWKQKNNPKPTPTPPPPSLLPQPQA